MLQTSILNILGSLLMRSRANCIQEPPSAGTGGRLRAAKHCSIYAVEYPPRGRLLEALLLNAREA